MAIDRRLWIDMDGVLVDIMSTIVKRYNVVFGTHLAVEDIKEYDLSRRLPGWVDVYDSTTYLEARPYEDACLLRDFFALDGITATVLSDCNPTSFFYGIYEEKIRFLYKHFRLPHTCFVGAPDKLRIIHSDDMVIDDHPGNIEWCQYHDIECYCIKRPWNGQIKERHGLKQIFDILKERHGTDPFTREWYERKMKDVT